MPARGSAASHRGRGGWRHGGGVQRLHTLDGHGDDCSAGTMGLSFNGEIIEMGRALSTALRLAFTCVLTLTACTEQNSQRMNASRVDTGTKASGAGSGLAPNPASGLATT